jgi:hypothetical protein
MSISIETTVGDAVPLRHPREAGPVLVRLGSSTIDTADGCPLHRVTKYRQGDAMSVVRVYLIAIAVTYLPALLAVLFGPLPILAPNPFVKLPFFYDWNFAFAFLVTFPCVVTFTMTDQTALAGALADIQRDGVLILPDDVAYELCQKWQRRFRIVNRASLIIAGLACALMIVFNCIAYSTPGVGFWVSITGELRSKMVACAFLYCICCLYSVDLIYIIRSVAMSVFLNDVAVHGQLRLLPFHPDKCGGLRPIGRFGLRDQYVMTLLGINIAFLVIVTARYLQPPSTLWGLVGAAAVVYIILGPTAFVAPLLSFHGAMIRTKAELLSEIAQRLRVELQRLRKELPSGKLLREDEELIDRLRKVGAVIDQLPVWPFDAATLRRFLTAYGTPLIGMVSYNWLRGLMQGFLAWMNH